ncbi:MAG: hypothetical protein LBH40_02335 [Alphaproteobacteria bacterium]|jgi:hypothetical protein|nr:hypothetical protein [Alphaproteobacteria bacterium]
MPSKKVTLDIFKVVGKVQGVSHRLNLADLLKEYLPNTAIKDRILRHSMVDETAESDLINCYKINNNIIEGMLLRIKGGIATPGVNKDMLENENFTLQEIDVNNHENIEGFIKQSLHFVVKENYLAVHHRNDFSKSAIETYFATILKQPSLNLFPISEAQTEVDLSQTKQILISDNVLKKIHNEEYNDNSVSLNDEESTTSKVLNLSKDVKEKFLGILIDNKSLDEETIAEFINFSITLNVKKPKDESEKAILESLKITDSSAIKTKLHSGQTINNNEVIVKAIKEVNMVGDKYLSDSEMYRFLLELINETTRSKE